MQHAYAAFRGCRPGAYATWAECSWDVNDFSSATFKKYAYFFEAEEAHSKFLADIPRNTDQSPLFANFNLNRRGLLEDVYHVRLSLLEQF